MGTLLTLDQQIAQSLRASEESGELQTAKDWGKPFTFADGYDETPEEFRMAFKALKNAGFVPAEVELLNQVAAMKTRLAGLDAESSEAIRLRTELMDLQLKVSLRMEHISRHGL